MVDRPTADEFTSLLVDLKVNYQPLLTIVADGSATVAHKPGGWAAATWNGDDVETLSGFESHCTNNRAELQGFVHALWYWDKVFPWREANRVLCVSDSEVTVKAGRKEYSREGQGAAWAAVESYERRGVNFQWVWVPRNSNPIHAWCDRTSREARLLAEASLTAGSG